MINPVNLLLGFKGRIGRVWWWAGILALVAVSPFSLGTVFTSNPLTGALAAVRGLGWIGVIWTLALLWLLAALNTKRLHDRGLSGWLAVIFYAPAVLSTLQLYVPNAAFLAHAQWWLGWVTWWTGAAGLWFLIQLGFYRGTRGPNGYDDRVSGRDAKPRLGREPA